MREYNLAEYLFNRVLDFRHYLAVEIQNQGDSDMIY